MMRALVIGGSGFVGRSLLKVLGADRAIGTFNGRNAYNMVQFDAVHDSATRLLKSIQIPVSHVFVLFGTINPDACFRNPADTARVNVDAVKRVISDVLEAGIVPVYISSDYVFDGSHGLWREDETQSPTTEYGRQKAAVEQWLSAINAKWIIARLSKVVSGEEGKPSMLGSWISDIRAGRVMQSAIDQIFSPIHVDDATKALVDIAASGQRGIFHVAGHEVFTRYELNKMLVDAASAVNPCLLPNLRPCLLSDISFAEPRPYNTSLCVKKLINVLGVKLRPMSEHCADIATAAFASGDH